MAIPKTDLALSGLTKSYGTARAVDGITLRIAAGEMVALLGPSGCGKTTTLRMIAGLVEPTTGDILVGGAHVTRLPVHKRNIGMLFQNYALFPHMTVAQNVAFGLRMRRIGRADTGRRVADALDMVQLGRFADRVPAALSGGQQQRVALARALVIEPSILLLDEPLGALDKNLREDMQVELRQIQRRLGITAVLVTHDQEEAMTLADRIVIMRDGRLEQVGTPEDIYCRPVSRFAAGFIGASNFMRGTVASPDAQPGRGIVVQLRSGGRASIAEGGGSGEVLVAVRPEAVQLQPVSADAAAPADGVSATVEQVVYRGQATHFHLRLSDGEPFLAHVANRPDGLPGLSAGARVHATWLPGTARLVADA